MKKTLLTTLIAAGLAGASLAHAGTEPAAMEPAAMEPAATEPAATEPAALPPKAESLSEEARAVERRALAAQLAAYGLQADDPIALIAAARITQAVPTQEQPLEKPTTEGDPPAEAADKQTGVDLSAVDFLLDKARALSGGDQTILALADAVPDSAPKGAVGGPGRHTGVIPARTTETYTNQWRFKANESARMAVIGDGDTDLDCYIYDGKGNLIVQDDDWTDRCVLQWTPRWTGAFTLKIVNRGNVYNRYVIIWN